MASGLFLGVASGLVGTLLENYLVNPIVDRIRYLFLFRKNVQELHQKKWDLAAKETQMKEDVEEAKLHIQSQVINDGVREWLTKAENSLKDVEVLDSKMKKIRDASVCVLIADLIEEYSKFNRLGHRAKLPNLDLGTSTNHVDLKSSDAALKKIMEALKDDKGCKIILTTRNYNVCQHMSCEEIVHVNVLEDDEAWTLFEMNANLKKADSRVIGEAKKIAKECKGLPLAIVTLARALKGKALDRWKDARKKLERSGLMEIPNIQKEREISLMISYEHLEDKMAQTCFLLCALYPEDHSINVEDLVRYAWGLNLYDKANSIEEMKTQVSNVIEYLKNCCLLEDGDVGRYDPFSTIHAYPFSLLGIWVYQEVEFSIAFSY
ncbi:hypothetical protein GOBAR_DD21572 [Gossypium barbadense]|nr:hypothetical protein GOBAR_DD21572 [Gossypium barbadense]